MSRIAIDEPGLHQDFLVREMIGKTHTICHLFWKVVCRLILGSNRRWESRRRFLSHEKIVMPLRGRHNQFCTCGMTIDEAGQCSW